MDERTKKRLKRSVVPHLKDFVSKTYVRFKNHFSSKNEKKPKLVKGLSGIYSLKRLAE